MKKLLFLFVSVVAMVCAMTTLTGCAEETTSATINIESGMGLSKDEVSQETYNNALASKQRMDARLVEMFGKQFQVPCKENELPKNEDFLPYMERISKDKVIQKEIDYLKTLKTLDDRQAVSYVVFHFMCGDYEFAPFVIEL